MGNNVRSPSKQGVRLVAHRRAALSTLYLAFSSAEPILREELRRLKMCKSIGHLESLPSKQSDLKEGERI